MMRESGILYPVTLLQAPEKLTFELPFSPQLVWSTLHSYFLFCVSLSNLQIAHGEEHCPICNHRLRFLLPEILDLWICALLTTLWSLRNIFPLILCNLPICLGQSEAEGHSCNRSGRCITPETNSRPDFEGTACGQYLELFYQYTTYLTKHRHLINDKYCVCINEWTDHLIKSRLKQSNAIFVQNQWGTLQRFLFPVMVFDLLLTMYIFSLFFLLFCF